MTPNDTPDDQAGWERWLEARDAELPGAGGPALERIADRVIDRARLRRGDAVLDLGAGTGLLTRRAAAAVGPEGRVTALDSSPGCVEMLRRDSAIIKAGNVLPVLDRLESLPFDPGEFDAVVCRSALVYAEDLESAVREMSRVLVAGGRFSVFEPLPGETEWRGSLLEAGARFLAMEEALKDSGGPLSVVRETVRGALERAGLDFDSLVVRYDVSMEGSDAEEITREYLYDLPGELSAFNRLKDSFEESTIIETANAFGRAAAAGRVKGGMPCLFAWGTLPC